MWLAAACAAATLFGCALELDYGPPNPVRRGPRADGGGLDVGPRDGGDSTCATGCDDGLRCTADNCVAGVCVHTSTCPIGNDCVARGTGECRRPCTSAVDCSDSVDCTTDLCDPNDHHCAHTSNCPAARPVCLPTDACVPARCMSDAHCSDGDACNGLERCTSGICRAGSPVICPPTHGCAISACDPSTGACVRHLDAGTCDDTRACTIDACGTDGMCTHTPDDTRCATPNRCVSLACQPTLTPDPSGCAPVASVVCSSSPCTPTPQCVPSTGLCNFDAGCTAGHVCGPTGCRPPDRCTSDSACAAVRTSAGCATSCVGGVCLGRTCAPPPVGSCGVLAVDAGGCPSNGMCTYVPRNELCNDGDPISVDRCDSGTLTCVHTCPTLTNSCVTYTYTSGMCVAQRSGAYCATVHAAPTRSNCAAWVCAGSAATGDGCVAIPSNAACDDHATCTDDVCTLSPNDAGSCSNPLSPNAAMICDDLLACTHDRCDPMRTTIATGCTHTPDDSVCTNATSPLQCAAAYCAQVPSSGTPGPLPTGCALRYDAAPCPVGTLCRVDGSCAAVRCGPGLPSCDDSNPCNGPERCNPWTMSCTQGPPLVCPTIGMCTGVCTPTGCVPPLLPLCSIGVSP